MGTSTGDISLPPDERVATLSARFPDTGPRRRLPVALLDRGLRALRDALLLRLLRARSRLDAVAGDVGQRAQQARRRAAVRLRRRRADRSLRPAPPDDGGPRDGGGPRPRRPPPPRGRRPP